MSTTEIEWTKRKGTIGVTWNVTTGCNKVDRGCKNCYAEVMHRRLQAMGQPKYQHDFLKGALHYTPALKEPLSWKKPRTVFVNSMSDLFHDHVNFNFLIEVFKVIAQTPQHTYLVLTKRPFRAWEFYQHMQACSNGEWGYPDNVWLGTSINDQLSSERLLDLLAIPAKIHFVSYEPATGLANLKPYLSGEGMPAKLDWVIMGGESGPKADPMRAEWVRATRDACKELNVPFFFKQWGLWHPLATAPEPRVGLHVKRFVDGSEPMYRASNKSFNLLGGQLHQNFPA